MKPMTRREFVKAVVAGGAVVGMGGLVGCPGGGSESLPPQPAYQEDPFVGDQKTDVVSVTRIQNGNIDYAVREAIDLLGGISAITLGKERIMLKPNLVGPNSRNTTNPAVIETLASLMMDAGKDVSIGEGSAGSRHNFRDGAICRTTDVATLNALQREVFDVLGYTDLAAALNVPLINLHVGDLVPTAVMDAYVFDEIHLHRSLTEIDMLCSVPMMKTHGLATVTLGMKNLFGLWAGQHYGTVRSAVHEQAARVESSGTASAIVDMVRANKLGLVVIDASMAMEGQGPDNGDLVQMDLIIAGTNALATDMVGAYIMGFMPEEISTFEWAWSAGMTPFELSAIEVRGTHPNEVRRDFQRPTVYLYNEIGDYGPPC